VSFNASAAGRTLPDGTPVVVDALFQPERQSFRRSRLSGFYHIVAYCHQHRSRRETFVAVLTRTIGLAGQKKEEPAMPGSRLRHIRLPPPTTPLCPRYHQNRIAFPSRSQARVLRHVAIGTLRGGWAFEPPSE